jgi:hypothetical protein
LCSSVVRMGGEVVASRSAVALLLVVTLAGCGGANVSVGIASGPTPTRAALPSSTSTATMSSDTSSTSTALAPSSSTSPPTSSSVTTSTSTPAAPADSAVDRADPESVGREFFDAWNAGDESRMRLLMSDQQIDDWVFGMRAPSDQVECRSMDSETVQCDVTVIATGELFFALLRHADDSDRWEVDWASVSNVNEGGGG